MEIKGKSANLTELVYDSLRRDILSGRLQKGEALTEMGIADSLNVSRTPVREALRELEQEDLVTIRPNKGAVVIGLEKTDFTDIYYIRSLLEGIAAERAALSADEKEVAQLKEKVDLMEFYVSRGNYEKMLEMDDAFHHCLFDLCKSRMLCRILKELHIYAAMIRETSMRQDGRAEHTLAEHRAICNAISEHNPQKAKEAATQHIKSTIINITENHLI